MSDEFELVEDKIRGLCWRTKDRKLIPVRDIADSHLRNIALFLMDMGYQRCIANKVQRVAWLSILATEWQRRLLVREVNQETPCTFNKGTKLVTGLMIEE